MADMANTANAATAADTPRELTVSEASAAHDIPKRSLHRAIELGQVPARRVGPMFVVDNEAARLYGEVYKARRAYAAYTGLDNESESE